MCGISGIINFDKQSVEPDLIKKMTDSLIHRGPDGEGYWWNTTKNLAFGHRRLAILDLSDKGQQPMSLGSRFTITYNGELYNYREVREELTAKGFSFNSESDTEVLLSAFAHWGEACLQKLDGMFAFAIWDESEKQLFCARDRFGEKPFYYAANQQNLTFASEIKALKSIANYHPDKTMVYNYLQYNVLSLYNDKSRTFYEGIHRLEPGHFMKIKEDGSITVKCYWELKKETREITLDEAAEKLHEKLYESVKLRLRSDVTVGSSLSGGLDSSSIVMAMKNSGLTSSQKTFSARFKDSNLDEGEYIKAVNKKANTSGFDVYPGAEGIIEEFETLFHHQEEPYGSAGIYAQWEVMKLAKAENVTVLLDGQGADELFAGYPRYYQTYLRWLFKNNRKKFASEVKACNQYYSDPLQFDLNFILRAYFPEAIAILGKIKRNKFGISNEMHLNKNFHKAYKSTNIPFKSFNSLEDDLYFSTVEYGLSKLLRYSDKNSMAHSREVRLPYLSHSLVEYAFSLADAHKLSGGKTKLVLREAMKNELPELIANRKDKIGYEPPQKEWLKHPKMQEMLFEARSFALKEQYITEKSTVSQWQLLMVHQLFLQSSKGDI